MSIATTPTLLSLDRYAKIMGLNPVHFSGAAGTNFWGQVGSCEDIWPQNSWQFQHEYVSREELAIALHSAEEEIKEVLGFSPAPIWETEEVHYFDAPTYYGAKYVPWASFKGTSVEVEWGYVISGGARAVTAIETGATVTYSDPDGDTWNELATITVATAVTDKRQIKVFFVGKSGAQEWEIRPLKDVVISGGTATITIDSWLLLDPDLWNAVPTPNSYAAADAIDIEVAGNFVDTIDVYQETTDLTTASAEFLWEKNASTYLGYTCPSCNGIGCEVCAFTTQDGCISVRDSKAGIVTPFAATYDSDNSRWVVAAMTGCTQPDMVKISYQAGYIDPRYRRSETLDPLSDWFAQAIAWLATARLERDVCGCESTREYIHALQRDLTRSTRQEFNIRYESMDIFHCPFGTRAGEVQAWRRINSLTGKRQVDGGGF